MKVTELMIGDWVMSDNELLKVSGILRYRIYAYDAVEYYPIENLEPILLTSDILKSNGFELSEGRELIALVGLMFECKIMSQTLHLYYDKRNKDYSLYSFGNQINHILYVHELQHAIHECRIKKEIEL